MFVICMSVAAYFSQLITYLWELGHIMMKLSMSAAMSKFIHLNKLYALHILEQYISNAPIPQSERYKARFCCLSLLELRVRIPPEAWLSVSCECSVCSDRRLCDGPIARLEKSYWRWCVTVYDLETSKNEVTLACVGLLPQTGNILNRRCTIFIHKTHIICIPYDVTLNPI